MSGLGSLALLSEDRDRPVNMSQGWAEISVEGGSGALLKACLKSYMKELHSIVLH